MIPHATAEMKVRPQSNALTCKSKGRVKAKNEASRRNRGSVALNFPPCKKRRTSGHHEEPSRPITAAQMKQSRARIRAEEVRRKIAPRRPAANSSGRISARLAVLFAAHRVFPNRKKKAR